MSSEFASVLREQGNDAFTLCEAAALARRAEALLAALRTRLDAFADDSSPVRRLDAPGLERLRAGSDELAELTAQIALAVDALPPDALEADAGEIAAAARAALADGIVDVRRACAAASLLTAAEGLPARAYAIVCCAAHTYWDIPVADVLAAFRDLDHGRARTLVEQAGLTATVRFSALEPERALGLADALRTA